MRAPYGPRHLRLLIRNPSRFLSRSLLILAIPAICAAGAADPNTAQVLLDVQDGWRVVFKESSSTIECRHEPTGTHLSGQLSFTVEREGKTAPWTIGASRDYATRRLGLLDERQNVQGYVSVHGDAHQLHLSVLPRPPHLYTGKLEFAPSISFGQTPFACRTRVSPRSSVVQLASGPADSLLNDSLFDPARDLLLRLQGAGVSVTTAAKEATRPPHFQAVLTASLENADASTITLELEPDYYRSRYVPHYRLIDRQRCPTPPTGWMSWNVYFDTAGENENLEEARIGARYLKPFGLQIWSIESWQDNSPRLPVSQFHNMTLRASPQKFPHGMKWLADQIRALGFRPGIWTVPFGTGDEQFYQAHKEWFLHDAQGKPLKNWCGLYLADPSQESVRKQMEESHRTMSAEWGYEFFKIDGMSGRDQGYSAHFYERPEVRAAFREPASDPYSRCVEALRRGIGPDRIFLACQGHYTGPEVSCADAARLGADIVHPNQPPHWENYLNQARVTQAQLFTHNLVWYSDPDTLLVGEPAPLSMVRLATTVVALPGQLTFFGDKLGKLSAARMRLLQQSLPVCDVHPLDLAPNPNLKPVWDLKIRRPFAAWDVVSVFNWADTAGEIKVSLADLGLDAAKTYLVYDFWNQRFLGRRTGEMLCPVEARANVLLAVHEDLARPQLLSTDRHVSQGGVEWTDSTWDATKNELVCSFNLIANDALTAVVHVPASYQLAASQAAGATLETRGSEPAVLVTLRRDTSGEGKFRLTFRKKS